MGKFVKIPIALGPEKPQEPQNPYPKLWKTSQNLRILLKVNFILRILSRNSEKPPRASETSQKLVFNSEFLTEAQNPHKSCKNF